MFSTFFLGVFFFYLLPHFCWSFYLFLLLFFFLSSVLISFYLPYFPLTVFVSSLCPLSFTTPLPSVLIPPSSPLCRFVPCSLSFFSFPLSFFFFLFPSVSFASCSLPSLRFSVSLASHTCFLACELISSLCFLFLLIFLPFPCLNFCSFCFPLSPPLPACCLRFVPLSLASRIS